MKFIKSSRLLGKKIRDRIAFQWKITRIMLFSLPIKERQQVINEYERGDYTINSLKELIQRHEKSFPIETIRKLAELEVKAGFFVVESPWASIDPNEKIILIGID